MKLYKVKVEFETVIAAKNQKDAIKNAEYVIKHEADDPASDIEAVEITDESHLPDGWDTDCFPFNDSRNLTIGEIWNENQS